MNPKRWYDVTINLEPIGNERGRITTTNVIRIALATKGTRHQGHHVQGTRITRNTVVMKRVKRTERRAMPVDVTEDIAQVTTPNRVNNS